MLSRAATTVLVVALLGTAAVWGHRNGWRFPSFWSNSENDQAAELWCAEHNVLEAECIECQPGLLPPVKDYGWCPEHGVAQCPLEHPDVAQLKTTPVITAAQSERASRALALVPRGENNSLCVLHKKRIQLASDATRAKVGLDIFVAREAPLVETIVAGGEVLYDPTSIAHLSSRVPGTVWRVLHRIGDRVEKGDVLALVDSTDVGQAKSQLLSAVADLRLKQTSLERLRPLSNDGVVAGRRLSEAEVELEQSQIQLLAAQQSLANLGLGLGGSELFGLSIPQIAARLQFAGLPPELAASLDPATTSNLYPLRSPLSGTVVDAHVVEGEVIDTSTQLFSVANVNRMTLALDVRQEDARYVSVGQPVRFVPSGDTRQEEVTGKIAWVSTAADPQSRSVKVRVDLSAAPRWLRANTFGTGRIVLREEPRAVIVPSDSVHREGCCTIVFVRDKDYLKEGSPKYFHVRKVRVGARQGEMTEIIAGLLPGEVVASKNSVVLEAQLRKSSLGAGCGCVH